MERVSPRHGRPPVVSKVNKEKYTINVSVHDASGSTATNRTELGSTKGQDHREDFSNLTFEAETEQ